MAAFARPLLARGFQDAGTHRVREMPAILRLLVHPGDALSAAIVEHDQAGLRLDLVSRYRNGTSVTFTTSESSGLDSRPGHSVVTAPGASPLALLARARSERPAGPLRPVATETAAGDFEQGYAESMARRKLHEASAHEGTEISRPEAA